MKTAPSHIPLNEQMIGFVRNGLAVLSEETSAEVKEFVLNNQLFSGAFSDRHWCADNYYSVFGALLLKAMNRDEELEKLYEWVKRGEANKANTIDRASELFIRTVCGEKPLLNFKIITEQSNVSFAYKTFLFFLIYENQLFNKGWLKTFVRSFLSLYRLPGNSPVSFWAALTVAGNLVGKKSQKTMEAMLEYFTPNGGFSAFQNDQADLLSTSVALFALQHSNHDLRMIKPGCLEFVQNCYDGGAFLAGNGDESHDIEYTFYGLLALGILATQE